MIALHIVWLDLLIFIGRSSSVPDRDVGPQGNGDCLVRHEQDAEQDE